MNQVILDADDIERFARALEVFSKDLQGSLQKISGESKQLSQTWRDPAHQKFQQDLDQTTAQLRQFINSIDTYAPFLREKARRARAVHS